MQLKNISVEDYSYHLPDERIAKYPLEKRENSSLLIYNQGTIDKDIFYNIPSYIPSDYLMVFNNARVVSARLLFQKETGANIEIFCLEPYEPGDYAVAFQQTKEASWKCMVGNLKKWKNNELSRKIEVNGEITTISAHKKDRKGHYSIIHFTWDNDKITFGEILDNAGIVPIPPYLNRESESIDKDRYQTHYSRIKGSVAAPTAGLHFGENTLQKLEQREIAREEITLHVGAGTFRPVQSESVEGHEMHTEHFSVTKETLNNIITHRKKILAVGTTTVRTLESLYWLGVKLINNPKLREFNLNQWEHTELKDDISVVQSLKTLNKHMENNNLTTLKASTQVMITPGYDFRMTEAMITNFHQPKSTLILLIAAFIGEDWRKVYDFALKNDFRFLSYGDSSLLFPKKQ